MLNPRIPTTRLTLMALGLALSLSACGKAGIQDVKLSSAAYSTSAALSDGDYAAVTATTAVTGFSFCVNRVKLETEDGSAVKKEGETGANGEANPDDISFAPGLIDVSSGTAKSWGTMNIPVGFKLSKLKIKVHKDKNLCGVDYSLAFNGQSTSEDIEFKFKFDPAIDLSTSTSALQINLDSVVTALKTAASSGSIASLKDTIEKAEGSGSKGE